MTVPIQGYSYLFPSSSYLISSCSTFCFSNYHLVVLFLRLLVLLHSHWDCHIWFLLERKTFGIWGVSAPYDLKEFLSPYLNSVGWLHMKKHLERISWWIRGQAIKGVPQDLSWDWSASDLYCISFQVLMLKYLWVGCAGQWLEFW